MKKNERKKKIKERKKERKKNAEKKEMFEWCAFTWMQPYFSVSIERERESEGIICRVLPFSFVSMNRDIN